MQTNGCPGHLCKERRRDRGLVALAFGGGVGSGAFHLLIQKIGIENESRSAWSAHVPGKLTKSSGVFLLKKIRFNCGISLRVPELS